MDKLNIIFEDENLLVINKPSGLLSIRDDKHPEEKTAIDAAVEYLRVPAVYPVHRLDRDTSGVLIIAKTPGAQKLISDVIQNREMRKLYVALVEGEIRGAGKINLPILRTESGKVKIDRMGKQAYTEYRIRKKYRNYTLLEVEPKTGRTHQIRVHLSHIGHPLAYDRVYGSRKPLILRNANKEEQKFKRMTLHASDAYFTYWKTENTLHFKAPMPDDFRSILFILDKQK